MNQKLITISLVILLLLQSSSSIHMNYDVDLDNDQIEDELSFVLSDFSSDNTKVEYKEKIYSNIDIDFESTLKNIITFKVKSIYSSNPNFKLNSKVMLEFNVVKLFTVLENPISLKNDKIYFITSFISSNFFTFWEDYNSVIFNQLNFSVFYLNNFSIMVRFYYFAKN